MHLQVFFNEREEACLIFAPFSPEEHDSFPEQRTEFEPLFTLTVNFLWHNWAWLTGY